ncbi:hypothetical protein Y032_0078g1221 [Ancylostoma ceylanicum]|nr:hypothetical protein Y032_0078g1221 [Ancylostoma ceylanicum]
MSPCSIVKSLFAMKLYLVGLLLLIVNAHTVGSSLLTNETDAGGPLVHANIDKKSHKFIGTVIFGIGQVLGSVIGGMINKG